MIKIIEDAINKFKSARKGEEVRNALVDVAEFAFAYSMKAITFGTEISENETVASSDYFDGMGYLNTQTGDLFKVEDGKWIKKGNISGKDGESITGTSEIVEGGVKVTLSNKDTEEVIDTFILFNGQDGQNGVSLTVEHSKSGPVTTVTIKNAETGAVIDTFEIYDGKSGTGTGDMIESDYVGESATKSVHKADTASSADSVEWENVKNVPDFATSWDKLEGKPFNSIDGETLWVDKDGVLHSSITINNVLLVPFSTGTDEKIQAMVNAYYDGIITLDDVKSVWSVGDSRTVHLSAMDVTDVDESHAEQDVEAVIIDFDHDELTTAINGKTKALITVHTKNCLNEKGYMNSTDTNIGGWEGCARRTWCNNVFKNAIPSTIKGLIKNVNKKNYKVYNSTTLSTTSDSCFLLSETEIFGSKTYSAGATEGTQYEYYKTSSNRIKQVNGSNDWWWERSPFSDTSYRFCCVNSGGSANGFGSSDAGGLAPGFCM